MKEIIVHSVVSGGAGAAEVKHDDTLDGNGKSSQPLSANPAIETAKNYTDTETAARQSADAALQTNIDTEQEARQAGDENAINTAETFAHDINEDTRQYALELSNDNKTYTDDQIAAAEQYTDTQIANAELSKQIWLPAVQTLADLEAITPPYPNANNYLCRVINDGATSNNGTYQWIAGDTAWTYFSDNLDFVDDNELAAAIANHNTSPTSHEDIRQGIVDETQRAEIVEGELSSAIESENARATGVETTLNTAITNEATARTTADTTLQTNISAKVSQTDFSSVINSIYDILAIKVSGDDLYPAKQVKYILFVDALPSNPDQNTLYLIEE
jgi:hypothetical protein